MLCKLLLLLVTLSIIMGSYAYGEPAANYSFSFSAPTHGQPEGQRNRCTENSLRDPFRVGAKVVLVRGEGIYSAKVARPCTYVDGGFYQGSELTMNHEDAGGFGVAVVGVDRAAVQVVPLQEDANSLSREAESEVRRVLAESFSKEKPHWPSQREFKFSPDIFRADQARLLRVSYDCGFMGRATAPVLIVNNNILPLPGTFGHIFFSVNSKLHLACFWTCRSCSRSAYGYPRVYDLSGKPPKIVWIHPEDGGAFCAP
jgi:hypothetical protein